MTQTLGQRLRAARLAADLTQVELAAYSGVLQQALSAYERDLTEPGASSIRRICRATGISSDWLLGLSGEVALAKF